MAIGDGGNDLPMIKAASDFVTADNKHDGVAVAIEKFILA